MLEFCATWPKRWDWPVAPTFWLKRNPLHTAFPGKMSPFELLFGCKTRTALDIQVPHMDNTDLSGSLDAFTKQRKQILREVRQILEKRHNDRVPPRPNVNARIARLSSGMSVMPGDFMVVKDNSSDIHKHINTGMPENERWAGPWKVPKAIRQGLVLEFVREDRQLRRRGVATSAIERFYPGRVDLGHSITDELFQDAWYADLGLTKPPNVIRSLHTLLDWRKGTLPPLHGCTRDNS